MGLTLFDYMSVVSYEWMSKVLPRLSSVSNLNRNISGILFYLYITRAVIGVDGFTMIEKLR